MGSTCARYVEDNNSKAKFDMMFDPTAGMFKDLSEKGAVVGPFKSQNIGPMLPPVQP
jgi:hypothetical protein